jgi:hypothetical protein
MAAGNNEILLYLCLGGSQVGVNPAQSFSLADSG